MFCPKCGVENLDSGSFCRKCGVGLPKEFPNDGSFRYEDPEDNKRSPHLSGSHEESKKGGEMKMNWQGAMTFIGGGLAFVIISFVLAFQPMGAGWWFWLLIPGFGGLGLGIGQAIALSREDRQHAGLSGEDPGKQISGAEFKALPPNQTAFVEEEVRIPEKAVEFAAPSVTEDTTRNLEIDNESETTRLRNEEEDL